jgi:hypothetical protein
VYRLHSPGSLVASEFQVLNWWSESEYARHEGRNGGDTSAI